jgi:hypothetical protein
MLLPEGWANLNAILLNFLFLKIERGERATFGCEYFERVRLMGDELKKRKFGSMVGDERLELPTLTV